jgi:hypothetical protein
LWPYDTSDHVLATPACCVRTIWSASGARIVGEQESNAWQLQEVVVDGLELLVAAQVSLSLVLLVFAGLVPPTVPLPSVWNNEHRVIEQLTTKASSFDLLCGILSGRRLRHLCRLRDFLFLKVRSTC